MLADKNSSHTHPRTNAHTGDKHLLVVLLGDVQTGGDLSGTSCKRDAGQIFSNANKGTKTYCSREGGQLQWHHHEH